MQLDSILEHTSKPHIAARHDWPSKASEVDTLGLQQGRNITTNKQNLCFCRLLASAVYNFLLCFLNNGKMI